MEQLNILVYGAGAVGLYFGGKLMQAGHLVTFIDRPEKVELLEEEDIRLQSHVDTEFTFTPTIQSDIESLPPQDIILIAVKSFQTYDIAINLLPVLQPSSIILSLQNGLENEKILADTLGQSLVMGTVPFFSGSFQDENTIIQNAPAKIIFGELDHQPSEREEKLSTTLSHAEIPHTISRNITLEIWKNFLWNNAYNTVSTLTQTTMGQISSCEPIQSTLQQMMSEAQQIAQAEGVMISDQTLKELQRIFPGQGNLKANMLQELQAGQKPELEPLLGTLLKLGKKHNISTPVNNTLYNLIQLSLNNYSIEEED